MLHARESRTSIRYGPVAVVDVTFLERSHKNLSSGMTHTTCNPYIGKLILIPTELCEICLAAALNPSSFLNNHSSKLSPLPSLLLTSKLCRLSLPSDHLARLHPHPDGQHDWCSFALSNTIHRRQHRAGFLPLSPKVLCHSQLRLVFSPC